MIMTQKKTYKDNKTRYLEARTCELCSTFKHVLLAPNTQVLSENTLHTNKNNIFILHITNLNINILKWNEKYVTYVNKKLLYCHNGSIKKSFLNNLFPWRPSFVVTFIYFALDNRYFIV